ncbi:MAG: sugar ABC transporter permease [Bacillota bacterium]
MTRKLRVKRQYRELGVALFYLSPAVLGFLVFFLGPSLYALYMSFHNWTLLSPPRWIGLANYQRLLFGDEMFWVVVKNTFYYAALSIPLSVISGFLSGLLLRRQSKLVGFYRTTYLIPYVAPMVAVAFVFKCLYAEQTGILNHILSLLSLRPIPWLTDPKYAMPSVVAMGVWKGLGFGMVVFLTGLQAIPQEFYEAAEIDGAGRWALTRHITIPLLMPTMFFFVVIQIIGAFQVFAQVQIMTGGGPWYSTQVYTLEMYNHAFKSFRMGYASAMAYILTVIMVSLTVVARKTIGRDVSL